MPSENSKNPVKAIILARDSIPWFSDDTVELPIRLKLLNRDFIECQIEALRQAGVENICVLHPHSCPAFKIDNIESVYFKRQDKPLGTAGSLSEVKDWIGKSNFLVIYGSTFIDAQGLSQFIESKLHDGEHWAGSIAGVPQLRPFGSGESIEVEGDSLLKQIHRRYCPVDRRTNQVLAGLFLLSARVLKYIPKHKYYDLKEQLFPALLNHDLTINVYPVERCFAMCTPENYLRLHFDLLEDMDDEFAAQNAEAREISAPEESTPDNVTGKVVFGVGCRVDPDANLVGPAVIGANCVIEAGAQINGPVVLGNNCRIGPRAVVQSSVIADRVEIKERGRVNFSILGNDHVVAANAKCYFSVIFGMGTQRKINFFSGLPAKVGVAVSKPAVNFRKRVSSLVKRVIDISVSLLLVAISWPICLLIAIAIKFDSRGPAIFQQRRCGIFGQEFAMLKFRTMVIDADEKQALLRARNEVDGPVFKLEKDPRITRVGEFLRRTSLDELPQLLNVIAGHMSLVGPRPLMMKEMRLNPHWRDMRLTVKPGITGLWQVNSRDSSSFHHWVVHDIEYARNQSLFLDLKVLFQTLMVIMKGK